MNKSLRTSIVIRSRLPEDEWKKSYEMGVRQYVILGSGLDTFAFRNAHLDGIILSKKVAEHGKPWKTFYDPDSMIQMLHSLGFSKMEDFGPEVLNRYYLEGRTDGLKKSGTSHLIRAEK